MLLYAWDLARYSSKWKGQVDSAPQMLGLLTRVLVGSTQQILQRHLARSFKTTTCELRGLKGKLRISDTVRRQALLRGKTICAFPELSIDNPKNRILRSTLARLAGDSRVRFGSTKEAADSLLSDIRAVLLEFEGVAAVRVQRSDFRALQLTRNDEPYRLPLTICALIQGLEMPTEDAGDAALAALLRDQIKFSSLFERFVRNFYKTTLTNASVRSEVLHWGDELSCAFAPQMLTDISITWPTAKRRLVIDTKYYRSFLRARFENSSTFHSGHLYQLYAYLRTQEDQSEAHKRAEGVLLYPATSTEYSGAMKVQGHEIRVETVDLSSPWEAIERRLLSVVRPEREMSEQELTSCA